MIWEAELCIIFTSFCFADHCYVRAGWETRNYQSSGLEVLLPPWPTRRFTNLSSRSSLKLQKFSEHFHLRFELSIPASTWSSMPSMHLSLHGWSRANSILHHPGTLPPPITFLLWLVGGWWYYQCQDQNSKIKNICKYNAFICISQKISLYWLPSEFPRHPQPLHCKSPTCFPFSSNSPNVTKLRLFRPWHRRLSAFLTFLFSLWLLGRLAQLLHSQCHHALSKIRLFQRAKRLYCTVVTFVYTCQLRFW